MSGAARNQRLTSGQGIGDLGPMPNKKTDCGLRVRPEHGTYMPQTAQHWTPMTRTPRPSLRGFRALSGGHPGKTRPVGSAAGAN